MRKISKYLANEEKLTLKICCKTKKHLFLQASENKKSAKKLDPEIAIILLRL